MRPCILPVEHMQDPALALFTLPHENQLRRIYEPQPGVFIAESPYVIARALDAGYEAISFLVEETQLPHIEDLLLRCPGVKVYTAPLKTLNALTGFGLTRGVLCAMRRRALPAPEALLAEAKRIAVLEEIVNPTNVGAIIRCAAALGMDAVLLTGGCADPLYRRAARVSMGTVFQVPWTVLDHRPGDWPQKGIAMLKSLGFATAAMALCQESIPIDSPVLAKAEKLALILGTEEEGLLEETIAHCDFTVRIPMAHGVDSLNVAAASAVAFWQIRSTAPAALMSETGVKNRRSVT